jgi:hypothetical protein
MKAFVTVVTTTLLAALSPIAAANPNVGRLENFTFTLTDLDLTDGITPSLTLSSYGGPPSPSVGYYANEFGAPTLYKTLPGPGTVSFSLTAGSASGTMAADSHSGFASALLGNAPQKASISAAATAYWGYVLSPNTRLTMTANASIEQYSAEGTTQSFLHANSGYKTLSLDAKIGSRSETLTMLINSGASENTGNLGWGVYTMVKGPNPLPVPEPASYLMMGAGLALLGSLRKMRSKN